MTYDCMIKDGAFVTAEKNGFQWLHSDLAEFEKVEVEMQTAEEDYEVEVKPGLFVWASDIDWSLING